MTNRDAADTAAGPRLVLLGPPWLHGASSGPLQPKDAALLALLALDGAHTRERLAAWLWPELPAAGRRGSLRQRLMRLDERAGAALFNREGDTVALAAGVRHDLDGALPLPTDATPVLLGAGHYDDLPELADWVARARGRLREQWHGDWARQAETLEQQQRIAEALPYARRLAADEPLHEHAQRRLMRLHYLRRDPGAALAVHAELVERLRLELGSSPGAETRKLAALIESGERGDGGDGHGHGPVSSPTAPAAAPPAGPSAVQLAQLRRPPQRLQRLAQWQQLQQAWADGRSVLLCAPGGMGKTRLLEDFADAHGIALRLRAQRGQARLPYALLAGLLQARAQQAAALDADLRAELARLDAAFGSAAAGPLQPLRLARALGALLDGVDALAIDDLHHADDASVELLPLLLVPPRQALLAARPEHQPPALVDWARDPQALPTVALPPLDEQGIADLMRTLALPLQPAADWAAALLRHTGGNPQLLLETMRALLRQPPPSGPPPAALPVSAPMQQLVEQRLQALSAGARALARVSALAGGDFDAALAADALQQPPAAVLDVWLELQAAQMCNERGFVHDLVGEAVLAALPAAAAQPLHRRIAEHLQARGGVPARCALHWAAAGDAARAAHSHAEAARAAEAHSRTLEAAAHWAAAADAFDQAGDAAAAVDAGAEHAVALTTGGRADEALPIARRWREAASEPAQQARSGRALAHVLMRQAGWAGALQEALAAAQAAATARLDAVRVQALLLAGGAAAQIGRLQESLQWVTEAEALAAGRRQDRNALEVLELKSYVFDRSGRYAEAEQVLAQAIALARTLGEDTERMTLQNNHASVLGKLARLPEALPEIRQAAALGERIGQMQGYQGQILRVHLGLFAGLCGDFRTSFDDLQAAADGLQALRLEAWRLIAEHNLAFLWMAVGQVARAQRIVAAPLDGLPRTIAARRLSLRQRLARLCGVAAGPWPDDWLDVTVELPVALSARLERAGTLPAATGLDECRAVAAEAQAMTLHTAWFNARVGIVAALHRLDDPAATAAEARALWRDLQGHQPFDAWWPEVLHVLQQALRAGGDTAAADAVVAQAIAWLDAARATLPAPFRASFDERNRVHAALRRQAQGLRTP